MDAEALICSAIRDRRVLQFAYRHHTRTVEPYSLGVDSKHHLVLLAFQIGGGATGTTSLGWKHFRFREMRDISLHPTGVFDVRSTYVPQGGPFSQVICAVS